MERQQALYSGKAKTLYTTSDKDVLICEFRDDTSAFDGTKKQALARKGQVNNEVNAIVMRYLQGQGIATHFLDKVSETESKVKALTMLPVECVVRNVAAGGLCKRLGIELGLRLSPPLFEFFLKNDALHDPFINEYHITTFGWATHEQVEQMKQVSFEVNRCLVPFFEQADLVLVDYKLEFGLYHGELTLGDEFTPDGCRLWDKHTNEIFDKDRFRQDLGQVVESYEQVAHRIQSITKESAHV